MEHTEARNSHAAERYLLKEMDDAERDRFEDHFFSCVECAADVKAGSRFMTAGRAVVREGAEVVRLPRRSNWKWTLQAAAVAAAVYAGYLIPRAPSPALISLRSEYVSLDETRSAGAPITIASGQLIILSLDAKTNHPQYEAEIHDRAGKLVVKAEMYVDEGNAYLLPGSLPAGSYSLVIFGVKDGNRVEVARRQLTVQ